MMKKRMKQGSVLMLTAALAFSPLVLPKVYAAVGIDTTREDCSVEIDVTRTNYKELNCSDPAVETYPVTVNLYKVADINLSGKYKAVSELSNLDFSDISQKTTAADWEILAADAKAAVEEAGLEVTATGTTVTGTGTKEDGTVTIDGLGVGLYLVDAQHVESDYHEYDFTPYLISLPNNYYYTDAGSQDDTWVYELVDENAITLKPERSDRYGDLLINKLLDTYNATLGGATFVFQVEASMTDIDTGEVSSVYSDVVSMTFENPGTDSVLLEDIQAGAVVTVTEVYSGAGYVVTSDGTQTVTIIADGEDGSPATVDFENTFDESLKGGSGVVNNFAYDIETGAWTHTATEDSTP